MPKLLPHLRYIPYDCLIFSRGIPVICKATPKHRLYPVFADARRAAERYLALRRLAGITTARHNPDDDGICPHCDLDCAEWHHWRHHTHEGLATRTPIPACKPLNSGRN